MSRSKAKPPHHNKVLLIVEETVQRAYLLDPDDLHSRDILGLFRHRILQPAKGFVPALIGKRAKKGADPMIEGLPVQAELRRMTGITYVIPDDVGNPSIEFKFTPTTGQQKPVKE
jgi:hypothetical protein